MIITCLKCGQELDTKPYDAKATEDVIRKLASDHASRTGCDWPSANINTVLKLFAGPTARPSKVDPIVPVYTGPEHRIKDIGHKPERRFKVYTGPERRVKDVGHTPERRGVPVELRKTVDVKTTVVTSPPKPPSPGTPEKTVTTETKTTVVEDKK